MRPTDSSYDRAIGGNVTWLLETLRECGHEVASHVNGSLTVDGTWYDSAAVERLSLADDSELCPVCEAAS